MSDSPRQLPHPQSLAVRQQREGQRGNAISVRQKPDQDAGWGTLRQPKRFELPLLSPHRIKSRLGYEAVPASEFWQFTVTGPVRLQVNRISKDRYANSVGVALLDENNQRVAPLVQSASGRGTPVEIQAGTYKVVASLGLAENLKDLVFEFLALPSGGRIRGAGDLLLGGGGMLTHRQLSGVGLMLPLEASARRLASRQLQAAGTAVVIGTAALQDPRRALQGAASMAISAQGVLHTAVGQQMEGEVMLQVRGRGRLAAVQWLDEPQNAWRAREAAGVLQLNRAYVRFSGGQAVADVLAGIAAALP
jgi:hypothetical protein